MDLDNNAHSVFLLHYHLVLVVKYRRQVFDDAISGRAKEILKNGITIKTMCIYFSRPTPIRK